MQFLNPAILAGLAAALVPLALHLLHRGRTSPLPFSNLVFLRRLHHDRMRKVRIRQWLVLLLRTSIIVLIVCAFARPVWNGGGTWLGPSSPVQAVVLLDRSYSTRYRLPSGPLFSVLRRQAVDLLGLFGQRDRLTVASFAGHPRPVEESDPGHIAERLSKMEPTEEATDLVGALQFAARRLKVQSGFDRELFLFTDLASYGWSEVEERRVLPPGVRVYVSQPDAPERPDLHIDEVRCSRWMLAEGKKAILRALLVNDAAHPVRNSAVDLYLDGERMAHREVDLGAGERTWIEFVVAPRHAGRLSGYVELEDDLLLLDNRRYFVLDVPGRIEVLVMGSRPSDTYYARRALSSAAQSDPTLSVHTALLSDLGAGTLKEIDLLLLCNLSRLNSVQTGLVRDFVASGGGLLLFPGPLADLSFYNRELLSGLAPVAFKGVIGRPEERSAFRALDPARPHHLLFRDLLAGQKGEDQAHFFASFELLPKAPADVLAFFTDGRPALVSAAKGEGRIFLSAFPLALEWTDLPLRGIFVPLLHRLVREAVLPEEADAEYRIGRTVSRLLPGIPLTATVQAETPSGDRMLLQPDLLADGRYGWKIPRVSESGLWRLWRQGTVIDQFAVNVDPAETDLEPISEERVLRIFGRENVCFLHPGDDLRSKVLSHRYGRELWREFLGLALFLLFVELWVARAPHDVPEKGRGEGAHRETL